MKDPGTDVFVWKRADKILMTYLHELMNFEEMDITCLTPVNVITHPRYRLLFLFVYVVIYNNVVKGTVNTTGICLMKMDKDQSFISITLKTHVYFTSY